MPHKQTRLPIWLPFWFGACVCVQRSQLSEHKARRSSKQMESPISCKPYVALYLAFSGDFYFLSVRFFHRCPCNNTSVPGDNSAEDADDCGGVAVRLGAVIVVAIAAAVVVFFVAGIAGSVDDVRWWRSCHFWSMTQRHRAARRRQSVVWVNRWLVNWPQWQWQW